MEIDWAIYTSRGSKLDFFIFQAEIVEDSIIVQSLAPANGAPPDATRDPPLRDNDTYAPQDARIFKVRTRESADQLCPHGQNIQPGIRFLCPRRAHVGPLGVALDPRNAERTHNFIVIC